MLFFLNYKNSSASTMFRPARACHVHQNRLQQYCHAIYRTSERCVTCILLSCQQPLSGTLQNNGKEVITSSAYGDSNIEHHMRTAGSSSLDIVVCILGQNPSFTVTWNIYLVSPSERDRGWKHHLIKRSNQEIKSVLHKLSETLSSSFICIKS